MFFAFGDGMGILTARISVLCFNALYSSLAHLPIVLNLSFRKLSVLPEDYVEAQAEYA